MLLDIVADPFHAFNEKSVAITVAKSDRHSTKQANIGKDPDAKALRRQLESNDELEIRRLRQQEELLGQLEVHTSCEESSAEVSAQAVRTRVTKGSTKSKDYIIDEEEVEEENGAARVIVDRVDLRPTVLSPTEAPHHKVHGDRDTHNAHDARDARDACGAAFPIAKDGAHAPAGAETTTGRARHGAAATPRAAMGVEAATPPPPPPRAKPDGPRGFRPSITPADDPPRVFPPHPPRAPPSSIDSPPRVPAETSHLRPAPPPVAARGTDADPHGEEGEVRPTHAHTTAPTLMSSGAAHERVAERAWTAGEAAEAC
jgi:hypothetical protein